MKNKPLKKINSFLRKPGIQRASVFAVAFLVIGSVAYFGTSIRDSSRAAVGEATMSLVPATGNYSKDEIIPVKIRIASEAADPVNVVQASLTFDSTKLVFDSITEGSAFPVRAATKTDVPGLVRVARATNGTPIGGTQDVVTVNLKVVAATGTAGVQIDPAFSYIVRSTDSANIMTAHTNASYTLRQPAPGVISVSPSSGPAAGGTPITITGTNFIAGAIGVKIGGASATNVAFVSSTTITAVTPAGTSGPRSVVVTNPDGQTGTKADGFTYIGAPTITDVSPPTGPPNGGTPVTITGTNFVQGLTVKFGGTAATNVSFVSSTTFTAVTPAHASGTVSVVATMPDGQTATKANGFTYLAQPPGATGVSPAVGYPLGGAKITITGTNFVTGATVKVGGVDATNVSVVNSTTITARTPARAPGVVSIVVRNPDGQSSTLVNGFNIHLAGDVNGDTRIDGLDLGFMYTYDGRDYPLADFDANGVIDDVDMSIILGNWKWQ